MPGCLRNASLRLSPSLDARERGCRARLQGGILADCPGNLECPKETSARRKLGAKELTQTSRASN